MSACETVPKSEQAPKKCHVGCWRPRAWRERARSGVGEDQTIGRERDNLYVLTLRLGKGRVGGKEQKGEGIRERGRGAG